MPNPLRDPELRAGILRNTAFYATAGAIAGGTLSILRAKSFWSYTLGTATNCGLVGFTYLAMRQLLLEGQLEQRRAEGQVALVTDMDRLFSSTVAGGATGSIWISLLFGPRRMLSAFVGSALVAGGGQICATTLRHVRQDAIIRKTGLVVEQELPWTVVRRSLQQQWVQLKQQMAQGMAWLPVHRITASEHCERIQTRLDMLEVELYDVNMALDQLDRSS